MTALFEEAEQILNTAVHSERNGGDVAIVIDRQGGLRVLNADGWNGAALTAEFGGSSVFKIRKSANSTAVEAWQGFDHCIIERRAEDSSRARLPLMPEICHPIRLQTSPALIADSNAHDSAV